MPSLRDVVRFLDNIPRGFSADGRTLGLGLASALQAQRSAAGADAELIRLNEETAAATVADEAADIRRAECVSTR